nr:hypothetical protein [uncultured Agathobaculum sp.]
MSYRKKPAQPALRLSKNIVFDSLSIGTTLPIELNVSKNRAKLVFLMPLTERLNYERYSARTLSMSGKSAQPAFFDACAAQPCRLGRGGS